MQLKPNLVGMFNALVVQWIEHPPSKRRVAGSNPARRTK
jgi:hypothetical protein